MALSTCSQLFVTPRNGDSVLISGPDPERVFLLAVIDQAQPEQSTIRVDGALRIVSSELDLTTKRGVWQVEQLQFYGAKLAAQISVTRLWEKPTKRCWIAFVQ